MTHKLPLALLLSARVSLLQACEPDILAVAQDGGSESCTRLSLFLTQTVCSTSLFLLEQSMLIVLPG